MRHPLVIAIASTTLALMTADNGVAQSSSRLRLDRFGYAYPETVAGFDCAKASLRVERMICRDSLLAQIDGSLADTYALLMRRLQPQRLSALRQSQRAWLARRNSCRNRECVATAYEARGDILRDMLDAREQALRSGVSRVGQCQVTRIDGIGPRLQQVQGERPSGTMIQFENGVLQISYDREAAALASTLGDAARVCLASIPADCEPGDDRGRIYEVTNLRTRLSWRMQNSSHSCGGA